MTKEEIGLGGATIAKSVTTFVVNYVILFGIALLMAFLRHTADFAEYLAGNLPVLFFMAGCLFLLLTMTYFYYLFDNKAFLSEMKNIWLLFWILDAGIILSCICGTYFSVYARPVALMALLALFLIGYRDAIFLNVVFSVSVFLLDIFTDYAVYESTGLTNDMFSALMICLIGGTFAVFVGKSAKTRGSLLGTGCIVILPIVVIIMLLEASDYVGLTGFGWLFNLLYGVIGSIGSVVLLFALMPVFEAVFGVLTVFRLRELTSPEAKLLKRLKKEAPGTFNHSMAVAQLVESCASALGENVELARACAYYHDVGKLRQPDYFTENQTDYNVHDELSPELSADIIRSHTKDGYDLILAYRLPAIFADVAREHHGTMPIKYFYTKALRMSDGEISAETYSYLGPKPHTKIAAVIMIADACEAATRSLTDRTPENVEKQVRSIIGERLDLDQFSECDITIRELNVIKETLVGSLTGMYHHRIAYPDVRFTREGVEEGKGERE